MFSIVIFETVFGRFGAPGPNTSDSSHLNLHAHKY